MIIRVFRGIVHDGMQEDYARFFREGEAHLLRETFVHHYEGSQVH